VHKTQLSLSIIALEVMVRGAQSPRQDKQIEDLMAHLSATAAPSQRVLLRLAPAVLIVLFGYLTIGLPLAILPLQVHDRLGYDTVVVGVTVGVQSLVTLVTRQLAGSLCDRQGPKHVVLLGAACSLAASLTYLLACSGPIGASATLATILAARAVLGIGESLLMTGALAWAISVVGPSHTGRVMVWAGIAMYAAIAAGAPLGIVLMTGHAAGGGFVAVALGATTSSLLAGLIGAFIVPVAPYGGERLPFVAVVARIAPFGAGLSLATLGFGAIAAFAALDFQSKGWSGAGFALASFGTAYIATRFAIGHWPDHFGSARVALYSLIVEACGQTLLFLAPAPAVAFAGAILTGAGFSLVFPSFGIAAVRQVSPANRGSALGVYVAFFDLGFALSGPLTGLVASALGYPAVFATGAVTAITALLAALYAARATETASRA
jgi:MFS family permease